MQASCFDCIVDIIHHETPWKCEKLQNNPPCFRGIGGNAYDDRLRERTDRTDRTQPGTGRILVGQDANYRRRTVCEVEHGFHLPRSGRRCADLHSRVGKHSHGHRLRLGRPRQLGGRGQFGSRFEDGTLAQDRRQHRHLGGRGQYGGDNPRHGDRDRSWRIVRYRDYFGVRRPILWCMLRGHGAGTEGSLQRRFRSIFGLAYRLRYFRLLQ